MQVIQVLNHAGVCVSYWTAWNYLRKLTTEAMYDDIIQKDHWTWVYDNLNMSQRVRHEHEGVHAKFYIYPTCMCMHDCT